MRCKLNESKPRTNKNKQTKKDKNQTKPKKKTTKPTRFLLGLQQMPLYKAQPYFLSLPGSTSTDQDKTA